MPVIPFTEWVPDASDLGNPGSIRIVNAVPGTNSYLPMPSLAVTSSALTDYPRGAIEGIDSALNVYQYAGDETNLYSLSGTTWSDISKLATTYATGTEERWEFARWKEKIIATNWNDNPQAITFGGANFDDLTTALKFRHVAVVGDFVVAGNTWDSTDGNVQDRVRWSAINDETDWTVSATTLSDFRNLKSGGAIQAVMGGEYGVVMSMQSIFRMTFVGSPTVFQIDEVLPGIGLLAPGGAAALADTVYFMSEHGFYAITGGTSVRPIGAGKVDRFFRNDIDEDYLYRVSSVADPNSNRVYWIYPGAGNSAGTPNKMIIYDTALDRWGYSEQELELVWRAGGVGVTVEGLDSYSTNIDTLGISLDASQWKGSAPLFSGFDTAKKSGSFSGANMTATLQTKEVELHSGARTQLNGFVPLVDGGTVTARVRKRNRQSDASTYGNSLSLRDSGRFTTRENANYHAFELTISGDWNDAIGVQVNPKDARKAQGRG